MWADNEDSLFFEQLNVPLVCSFDVRNAVSVVFSFFFFLYKYFLILIDGIYDVSVLCSGKTS